MMFDEMDWRGTLFQFGANTHNTPSTDPGRSCECRI